MTTILNSSGGGGEDQRRRVSYGFYPMLKAESISFKKEVSACVVIGTNPGFQMGVLIVESDRNDSRSSDTEDF